MKRQMNMSGDDTNQCNSTVTKGILSMEVEPPNKVVGLCLLGTDSVVGDMVRE